MNWLERFIQESQGQLVNALQQLAHGLTCLAQATGETAAGTTGTARSLAYQFGVPPQAGAHELAPRTMTQLPTVYEGPTSEEKRLDMHTDTGRYATAGFIANIGEEPFKFVLLGVDNAPSGHITMPAGASMQLPCIVSGLIVLPVDGKPAGYQAVLS